MGNAEIATESNVAAAAPASGAANKRLVLTLVKCAVSALLIVWILRGTNLTEIFAAVRSTNLPLLLLAFSLHFIGYYVSAHRWRVLLRAQGADGPIIFLIKSYMVGIFFSNFLPSTIGGDAVRAYDSWRVGKSKAGALAVIFVDRFLGMLALMLFALGSMLFAGELTGDLPYLHAWIGLGAAGMFAVAWLIFMPSRRIADLIDKARLPFSGKLQRILDKIINAFLAFQGKKDALVKALGLSIVLQTNVVIHYYLIAQALGFAVPFHYFFLIIPLAIFIMMIPVSINAIGIRENAFVFFLAAFAVTKPEAVAFAWLAYGIVILQGLLGGVVYALRR